MLRTKSWNSTFQDELSDDSLEKSETRPVSETSSSSVGSDSDSSMGLVGFDQSRGEDEEAVQAPLYCQPKTVSHTSSKARKIDIFLRYSCTAFNEFFSYLT